MALDIIGFVNSIVLLLSVVLVALAASVVHRFNKHFSEGDVKQLGHYVLLAMVSLLAKLLTSFAIEILPELFAEPAATIQFLKILGVVFVVLTAVFLIRVALIIKKLSEQFGFEMKE